MMNTDERLAYMAEQILRNLAPKGPAGAIAATAEHLALFWALSMKKRAISMLDDPALPLPDDVRAVFSTLRRQVAEAGRSGDSPH